MAQVTVVNGDKHIGPPKEYKRVFGEAESVLSEALKNAGFAGDFKLYAHKAVKGSSHKQGVGTLRLTSDEKNIEVTIQPGSNDTAFAYRLVPPQGVLARDVCDRLNTPLPKHKNGLASDAVPEQPVQKMEPSPETLTKKVDGGLAAELEALQEKANVFVEATGFLKTHSVTRTRLIEEELRLKRSLQQTQNDLNRASEQLRKHETQVSAFQKIANDREYSTAPARFAAVSAQMEAVRKILRGI